MQMKNGALMKMLALSALGVSLLTTQAYAELNGSSSPSLNETQKSATGEPSKMAGELFLKKNKAKPGVVTLPDGLQYKVLKEGTGERPSETDMVTVNYSGTLIDGTEFDSSYKRGQPATFPVNGVIAGWTEALKLMKPGSVWKLYVPSNLAYG